MNHADASELVGAYALDAVDDDERLAMADHLRDCPRCRAELVQHREVAAHLFYVGAPAPEGVWGRIAAELGEPGAGPSIPRLLTRRPLWVARSLSVAAATVALAVGALGWQLHGEQGRVRSLQAQVRLSHLSQLMTNAGLDPTSARLALASPDHKVNLTVVLSRDGTGYLSTNNTLPALGADKTYQLWGTTGDRTVSLGIIGNHPGIVAFPDPVANINGMALTAERAGGVVQSTNVPVATGSVPRSFSD